MSNNKAYIEVLCNNIMYQIEFAVVTIMVNHTYIMIQLSSDKPRHTSCCQGTSPMANTKRSTSKCVYNF